jgi:hypothetical protein
MEMNNPSLAEPISRELDPKVANLIVDVIKDWSKKKNDKNLHACVNHIRHYSGIESNQPGLCNPELGVLSLLEKILEEDRGVARVIACIAVRNLSLHPLNATILCNGEHHLVEVLVDTLNETAGYRFESDKEFSDGGETVGTYVLGPGERDHRILLCEIFKNLSTTKTNVSYLRSDQLGLFRVLVDIIQRDEGKVRGSACMAIANLSKKPDDALFGLCQCEERPFELLEALVNIVRHNRDKLRPKVLMIIMNLLVHAGIKKLISVPDLLLAPTMVDIISDCDEKKELQLLALKCLYSMLTLHENVVYFGEPYVQVVSTLMRVIQTDNAKLRALACAAIVRLCITANRNYLSHPSLGLIALFRDIIGEVKRVNYNRGITDQKDPESDAVTNKMIHEALTLLM